MRKQPLQSRSSFSCNPKGREKPLNESQVSNLVTENQKLLQQNDKLIQQLEHLRQEYESLATSGIQSIKSQRSKKIEFESSNDELNKLKIQKEKLIVDNECLRRTITKLQHQLDEQSKYVENLQRSQYDYEQLKQRLEETVQVVNDLEIQLQEQYQQQKQFEYNQKVITLSNQDTQEHLSSHQKMNEIQISQLKEQNNKLNKLLEERLVQLENITKLLNQRNEAYNKLQESYDQDITDMRQNNSKQKSHSSDFERKALQNQVNQLKQQVEKCQQNNCQHRSKVQQKNDEEQQKIIQDLSSMLKQKEHQIKVQEQQYEELQQNTKQIQTAIASNNFANNQTQQLLQQQVQTLMKELEIQKQQNHKIIYDYNQLRNLNQQLNEKLNFYSQSQQKMMHNYSHSFVSSPGRLDTYPIKTSSALTNRTNIMQNAPDSPFRKQKLHLLFTDDQQKLPPNLSTKKIVQVASKLFEGDQNQQPNKDRFILHD
ncbi:unnamed protein product [Paramecium primaurelia]|uniref:Uncharacterized protein n=1 Tax=Paramecium primaurelia TaxID=5886 RepID=A0A8S1KCB2_PARPR|nr:unnamed protein product [Paramecium primaurelia]